MISIKKEYDEWLIGVRDILKARFQSISLQYEGSVKVIPIEMLIRSLVGIMERGLKPQDINIIFPKGGEYEELIKQLMQIIYEYYHIFIKDYANIRVKSNSKYRIIKDHPRKDNS